jgi:hypothetical protein
MFNKITSIIVAVFVTVAVLTAAPQVTLKVNHRVTMAPTVLKFTVTIEPFEGNRKACLTIDGGEYHHSCWDVQGDKHPRTEWFERRIGAEGEYFATLTLASIVDDEVKFTMATTQFQVIEPGVPFVR